MCELVALAPGEKLIMGLSGGGGAALHAGATCKNADGTALFKRQLCCRRGPNPQLSC